MPFYPPEHHRRSIRIAAYDYSHPGAYFVTVVTQHRACLFDRITDQQMKLSAAGRMRQECWRYLPEHFPNVDLGACVIMPNHVHGILILNSGRTFRPPVGARYIVPLR